jgi:NADH:ubiquinone oxidoreductase subunit E
MIRRAAYVSAAIILLCTAALTADYVQARRRAVEDDKLVANLQTGVLTDASLAPRLAAEQKRITAALLARKSRVEWISVVLLGACAGFIASAKRLAPPPVAPPPPARLVQIAAASTAGRPLGKPAPAPRAAPPPIDVAAVDQIVAREGDRTEAAIPILQAIQGHYGYLPDEALQRVCRITSIPPSILAGTSSFYSRFRRAPVGEHTVRVCHGTACHVAGARSITEELRRSLAIPEGADTDPSRTYTLEEVACLGCCSLAPVLMVDEHTAGRLTPATAREALDAIPAKALS